MSRPKSITVYFVRETEITFDFHPWWRRAWNWIRFRLRRRRMTWQNRIDAIRDHYRHTFRLGDG